jgi:hypothetical protein
MPSLITYELTESGNIPEYIIDGGYYPNGNVLIGVSNQDNQGFNSKEELLTYLESYTQNWYEQQNFPTDLKIPFDVTKTVNILWDKIQS